MQKLAGFKAIEHFLLRPRWGVVMLTVIASVAGAFLFGWRNSWTPALMVAMPISVIVAALYVQPAKFRKTGEYIFAIVVAAIAICLVGWYVTEPLLDLFDVWNVKKIVHIPAVIAGFGVLTTLAVFFLGVRKVDRQA